MTTLVHAHEITVFQEWVIKDGDLGKRKHAIYASFW